MERKSYNFEALNNAINRDNATLLGNYTKVTKRTIINFKCHCGEESSKGCLQVVSRGGAFCKKCTFNKSIIKLHNTLGQTSSVVCTLETLHDTLLRDNAKLLEPYEMITQHKVIKFKCNCGENSEKNCLQMIKVSGAFCKECTRKTWTTKIKETNMERYGVECTAQATHVRQQIIETNLKNYGVENVLESKEVQKKIKQTIIKKYGVDHNTKSSEIKQKIKKTCLERYGTETPLICDNIKEKIKKTFLEKYNVEYYSQTEEYKNKHKETCLKKYGVESVLLVPEIKQKIKETFIKRYGAENPNKNPEVREKIRQTCLERYGVEYPSQNKEIQERTQKNAKKYKEYTMPSGKIIKVQGYEPFALDELVKMYEESDIITDRKDIPRITYTIEDKQKYYFPDIYIKSLNKIIEVKSTWTYKSKLGNIKEKQAATKLEGYDYEIWVYDKKRNKTIH